MGTPLVSTYGTLTLNADGSYSYVLDNANAAVQSLTTGQTLTETFTYTIRDGDGDTSPNDADDHDQRRERHADADGSGCGNARDVG